MPNSQSQMVMSNMPPLPPGFQSYANGYPLPQQQQQQYTASQGMQGMNPAGQSVQPQMINSAGAPISSAMRIGNSKTSRISWRNVHDLDIEQMKKSNDIETLESYLPNLLDSVVSQEEYEKLKPEALVKLLQICQMSLQYFDYTQDYLENLSTETQDEINKLFKKVDEDKVHLKKSKREIEKMKNEIGVKKEAIHKYKEFLKQRPQYKCHICVNKFFQNEDYLDSHIKRRHAHVLPMNANHPNFAVMQNMVFAQQLSQERQEFERQQKLLMNNEKFNKDGMLDKLELVLQKNRQEQKELQIEMQRRLRDMESQQVEVINKKQQENEFQRQQIVDLMKNMNKIHDEISNLKYREVVVQQTAVNSEKESQLQQLYSKQNELFEQNQKLKQQQIENEIKKQQKLLQQQQKLEEQKNKKKKDQELDYNESLVKQLIGEDNFGDRLNDKQDRKQVPSEIKTMTNQISEIRGIKNGNIMDKDTIEDLDGIYLGNPQKSSKQNSQNNNKNDVNNINQAANKFNSIASNLILQDHPVYNPKNQTNHKDDEEVPEEGEINDEFDNSEGEEDRSFDSNENDVSKDRGFNNLCEEEKEILEIASNKGKSQFNKTDKNRVLSQMDGHMNQKLKQLGINEPSHALENLPSNEVEKILDKVKNGDKNVSKNIHKNDDFDEDSQFEQSNGNKKGNLNNYQSGKSAQMNYSSKQSQQRNQLEESSQNYDESGYYNGSKGRTYDQQANPMSLNKQAQSLGDSFLEQQYEKKPKKMFDYEDSGKQTNEQYYILKPIFLKLNR